MPRHPVISVAAGSLPPSIFARLVERLATHTAEGGDIYPFHLGDTHLLPPEAARLEALEWSRARAETLYRYAAPVGDAELMRALDGKLRAKNGIAGALQITAGATHGIFCAVRACLDPHDEILLCAPHWPLVRGQVLAVGARPVEVPLMSRLAEEPELDVAELLAEHVGPRTSAIYFATPNNPDGKVLGAGALAGIAEVARAHDLWVLADEVYEDYPFDGRHHVSIASLPGMAERTLTVFSFSKSYGQAGLRVGYVVGPEEPIVALRRLANHTVYNVPVAMQRAALVALTEGESFLRAARAAYAAARDQTMAALHRAGLRARAPEGGSYVFVDLGRDAQPVLERLAAGGVLLAPGSAFGKDYGQFARLCYTATEPARLAAGLEELVRIVAT